MYYVDLTVFISNNTYTIEYVSAVLRTMETWLYSNIEDDEDWNWSPWSFVSYTNLPIGIYFDNSEDAMLFRMVFSV